MVWDKTVLLERLMNNDSIIPILLNAFIEDAPNSIRALKAAFDEGDMASVGMQAHTIKGMAANLAAEPLTDVALSIEKAAKDGNQQAAESFLPELLVQFDALVVCFEEELK